MKFFDPKTDKIDNHLISIVNFLAKFDAIWQVHWSNVHISFCLYYISCLFSYVHELIEVASLREANIRLSKQTIKHTWIHIHTYMHAPWIGSFNRSHVIFTKIYERPLDTRLTSWAINFLDWSASDELSEENGERFFLFWSHILHKSFCKYKCES